MVSNMCANVPTAKSMGWFFTRCVSTAELYANSGVEEQKVKDIVEMGFTAEQARAALDKTGMDKQAAINFILSQV